MLRRSAKGGYAEAQHTQGCDYETGCFVKYSIRKAVKWWKRAAAQDHPEAQYDLGRHYFYNVDKAKGVKWFQRTQNWFSPVHFCEMKKWEHVEIASHSSSGAQLKLNVEIYT